MRWIMVNKINEMDYGLRQNQLGYGQYSADATISQICFRMFYYSPVFTT